MYPKQVKQIIANAVEHPRETPAIFLEGPPGIGKSAIPKQVSEAKAIGWLDTRASQHDPTDFRGIPAIIDGKAIWLPPQDIPFDFHDNIPERGIWLLDEVTSAPPLVQAVLYQAILDHQVGEHRLKPDWYIIAAGNRIEDRAVTYRMSTALSNRFVHINFEVSLDDWIEWATWDKINPNIIAFMRFKPDVLFAFNPESSEKAFPTPRTWEFASKMIQVTPSKLLPEMLEGTVGKGATAEFMAFLKVQTELPDLKTIYGGDNFWPKRMDLKYALVAALATRSKGVKEFERMVTYSDNIDTEFAILLLSMLVGKDEDSMAAAPSFERWARKHSDVIVSKKML